MRAANADRVEKEEWLCQRILGFSSFTGRAGARPDASRDGMHYNDDVNYVLAQLFLTLVCGAH